MYLHLDAQVLQEGLGFINHGTIPGQHQGKALALTRHASRSKPIGASMTEAAELSAFS